MKLLDKTFAARLLSLGMFAALAGCNSVGGGTVADAAIGPNVTGPGADYPVTIGAPYAINGVTYTPADVLNYDEVGYVTLDDAGSSDVSGAHHTLPLPSYVEVTSLESGRTILVRLTRRGPTGGNELIGLSQGAVEQLGINPGTPVRVRRVNPPEQERAALRNGGRAPDRMETPASLVEVLRRKLPAGAAGSTSLAAANTTPTGPAGPVAVGTSPSAVVQPAAPPAAPTPNASPLPPLEPVASMPPEPKPAAATTAAAPVQGKGFGVQVAVFSTRERADRAAAALGGVVSETGKLFRVRTGPFASRKEAEASLANVKTAGYSDARIY